MWLDVFLVTVGLAFLIVGILYKKGYLRAYYWMQPFSYYRVGIYILIPFGIVLLMLVVTPIVNGTFLESIFYFVLIFFVLLSIFIYLFQPRFAKPDWINWLEKNHSDIIPELRQEIWHMRGNRKEIKEMIDNQAKLEAWIEEFRRKRAGQP